MSDKAGQRLAGIYVQRICIVFGTCMCYRSYQIAAPYLSIDTSVNLDNIEVKQAVYRFKHVIQPE